MTDRFRNHSPALTGPASGAFAITPDDNTALEQITRALYIGTGGDVAVIMQSGGEAIFTSVPAGLVLPVRVERVKSTGTTASDIVGLV